MTVAHLLILPEARPIPDTPKTLASTSPSGSVSPKIIKNKSQGATPGHRTLPLPNIARCDTTTSHPATLSHLTLRHRAIAPCHFRLSHSATQKAIFRPPKTALPAPFPPFDAGGNNFSNPDISAPFGITGTTGVSPVALRVEKWKGAWNSRVEV